MANLNYNKCFLAGRLVADPELKQTQSGTSYTRFTIAITRRVKAKNAEQPESDFLDCEAWNSTAEAIVKHFKKSNNIFVETEARLDRFQDKDGNKRSIIRFTVNDFRFVETLAESQQNAKKSEAEPTAPAFSKPAEPHFEEINVEDDDIPF